MYEVHSFDSVVSFSKNYQVSIFQSKVEQKQPHRIYRLVIHNIQLHWLC